jgi:hypothetical protein
MTARAEGTPFRAISVRRGPVEILVRTSSARDGGGRDTESEQGPLALEKLEVLILARLSVAGRKPPSDAQVSRSLQPAWARRLSPGEWRESYARALASLRRGGAIEPGRLALTAAGRARLKAALRLRGSPRAKSWSEFRRRHLPHLLFADTRPTETVDPRLALLADRLSVPVAARSTTESVLAAWLKRQLGVEGKASLESVGLALLGRELGLRPKQRPRALLRQSLALLSGATKDSADAVLDACLSRWASSEPARPNGAPSPATPARAAAQPARLDPASLDPAFVQRAVGKIERAAREPKARRFGPDKVFIASVWESLARDPELRPLGEAGFKHLLVEAHRRGLLALSRADMVAAMDPEDVAASETRHLSATYHFIARGASA